MPERNELLYSQCFCYISDKQCKNNKYWFLWQNLKVYFFQLGMTFHGMGLYSTHLGVKSLPGNLGKTHLLVWLSVNSTLC